ncbi:hypothetical protein RF11_00040 [Thelohanellus kitauei]|uniref:Uncharacterized protein n=1 Tax=Thelohanellus kitauei TaxID=669202 RepID=A0A0C2N334_THEKT|nr:hypothetical protein RF11_00040 [Thelohanellus kitauei]
MYVMVLYWIDSIPIIKNPELCEGRSDGPASRGLAIYLIVKIGSKVGGIYNHGAILMQHGLNPIGFVESHVVHYENTFVYTTGKEQFKGLHEVSTKTFFIEWMILCVEECLVTSVPEIRNRPI